MEGEIPTRIMILKKYPITKDTNKIVMYMLYQSDITYYINISIEFNKNLYN